MALTRKVTTEDALLNQQGEPEGRSRFESARFKVKLPAKADDLPAGVDDAADAAAEQAEDGIDERAEGDDESQL